MKGKVALIAGAANDIGQAIAARFANSGAKLVLVDSDPQKLKAVSAAIGAGTAELIAVDPTDGKAVAALVRRVAESTGGIDILVNNIDSKDGVAAAEGTLEKWQQSLQQNLLPVVSFTLAAIPAMKQKKYGRIVNVGSLEYLGTAGQSNYSTAKSAVFGMTRALAQELAKDGITVNQVLKGDIKGSASALSEEAEQKVAAQIPVQRLGKPDEVAFAVAYFASDAGNYVTGQNLIVCGGKSIHSSMSA